jgi:hypothetical protein
MNMSRPRPALKTSTARCLPTGDRDIEAGQQEGQGANATTNDATWRHRFYTRSSGPPRRLLRHGERQSISRRHRHVHVGSTSQMVSDVQAWLNSPPRTSAGWCRAMRAQQARPSGSTRERATTRPY